jgi:hypothetical protein
MKLDPGMHIGMHLVFFGKAGVTDGSSLLLKFQAKEEVANQISLEASLNRGFPSDSENARLSEPPFCHNVLLFMRVV